METKGFSQLIIIKHILVNSFLYILIHMLLVYGYYKHFNSFSAGTVFMRRNLTSVDVRFWRIKTVPALKGLNMSVKSPNNFREFYVKMTLYYNIVELYVKAAARRIRAFVIFTLYVL